MGHHTIKINLIEFIIFDGTSLNVDRINGISNLEYS